ncbi:hypothetical protein SAMN06298216_2600 [Spirosomataceae bacterium TFI 002]|nr:hypothetical protein SAMN06298216_2600 [Spirosomataceae bacterium TFI 002]
MAEAKIEIVDALRSTAKKMQAGKPYMWGHMGSCNCGNLAQEVTNMSKAQIHNYALQGSGDWSEQLNDYCETSAMPMDLLIFELLSFGFSVQDLRNLEYLSDEEVLNRLPVEKRHLRRNVRHDVVVYLNEWANMLEERLLYSIELPDFLPQKPQINVKTT